VETKKHELGNNFIRRGGGLQRTPPRKLAEAQSLSDSEESKSPRLQRQNTELVKEVGNVREEPESSGIQWVS